MELKSFKGKLKSIGDTGEYEAYASVFGNVDRDGDIVKKGAFSKTLQEREIFPIVWFHRPTEVLGGAKLEEDNYGLKVYGKLNLNVVAAREKYELMKQGVVADHSFAYDVIRKSSTVKDGKNVRVLEEVRLYEVSPLPVGFAANPKATMTLVKASNGRVIEDDFYHEYKSVVGYQDLPLADRGQPWDASKARKRLLDWARDEARAQSNGDVDWGKYRKGFLWFDSENPDIAGSYKLPIADIIDGDIKAVPRAIFAAAAVVMGARGGADIPSADVPKVKNHLAKYYKKLDMTPPWEKSGVVIQEPDDIHSWTDEGPGIVHPSELGKAAVILAATTMEMKLYAESRRRR